ncbi:MAG: gamma-butyrobetaine hydroxylase-like domain-containing protein [Ferrovibrio sp.]|uniref:gamma-butyrobetaine hydroxylase-like domain-containing protein n=1 Tax=Ferrovibrio sp. TaxID=1917215 RepID=UPI00391956EF
MLLAMAAAAVQPDLSGADAPNEVILRNNGSTLELRFADSASIEADAGALRAACRCAWCTKARVEGAFPGGFSGLSITQIRPIGTYAVNLHFSDGHDRGVFPWSYMRQLSQPDT